MKKQSQRFYYDGLRDAYHLICENSYRTTASGRRVELGEPDERTQFAQSDAIQAKFKAQRLKAVGDAGKAALRSKGAVPTKNGKKLFNQFMQDANTAMLEMNGEKEPAITRKQRDYLEQVYNSANSLIFEKWVLFITEML